MPHVDRHVGVGRGVPPSEEAGVDGVTVGQGVVGMEGRGGKVGVGGQLGVLGLLRRMATQVSWRRLNSAPQTPADLFAEPAC